MTEVHGIDCDGWVVLHSSTVVHVDRTGRGMWQAQCGLCDWAGTLVGPDARTFAKNESRAHYSEITCDGRCRDATDQLSQEATTMAWDGVERRRSDRRQQALDTRVTPERRRAHI